MVVVIELLGPHPLVAVLAEDGAQAIREGIFMFRRMSKAVGLVLGLAILFAPLQAVAGEDGDWLVRTRLIFIEPNDDSAVPYFRKLPAIQWYSPEAVRFSTISPKLRR